MPQPSQVAYNGETRVLSPTQVLAAFFTKMKSQIRGAHPAIVTPDVVISVPAYFTDAQRRAVRDAASIAGLNCERTLNEGTAAALSFGIYKSAKKEFSETGESKVLLLDMGAGHFTATVAAFTNTALRITASASDDTCGGREIDAAIARHFAAEFHASTGLDAWANRKARVKLMVAAEKAKIAVTPYGVNIAPVSVECLLNDRDYSTKLTIEKLDELAAPYMLRVQSAIRRALDEAGVTNVSELLAVELVGGGMRPRVAKRAAAEALGLPLNEEAGHGLATSLNLEEAIARGSALACAMLVPQLRVKDFGINDRVGADVKLTWDVEGGAAGGAGMDVEEDATASAAEAAAGDTAASSSSGLVVFKAVDESPNTRRITFKRSAGVFLTLEYDAASATNARVLPRGHPTLIGRYRIDLPSDAAAVAEAVKIRADVKVDKHGCFSVVRADYMQRVPETAAPAAPEAATPPAPAAADGAAAPPAADAPPTTPTPAPAAPAAKRSYVRSELSVRTDFTQSIDRARLAALQAEEAAMAAQDAEIHATQDTRNSLEAAIYSTRSALEEALAKFAAPAERDALSAICSSQEEWLYGDGFEASRATYEAKLKELRSAAAPLQQRKWEAENRYDAVENLNKAIDDYRGVLANRSGKHAHLTQSDRDTLRAATSEAEVWLKVHQAEQAQREAYQDAALRVAEVEAWRAKLHNELGPIAAKAPPAPSPPPAAEDTTVPPPAAVDAAPQSSPPPPPPMDVE